jgi:sugar phosphate isomerase/epimerase
MNLGFRILDDSYIDRIDLDLVQISIWHFREEEFRKAARLAQRLRELGKRFVIHPSSLDLSETRGEERKFYLNTLKRYAEICDLGLIVHDETLAWGGRLEGVWKYSYMSALAELEQICPVSIENARDSSDIFWFWRSFARSITFDIGHFVAAGVDCFRVIHDLTDEMIKKIDYVHLHRNNERKDIGITDHWPLVEGCMELEVLKKLLERKPEVNVILEVDGEADIKQSLEAIRSSGLS